MGINGMCDTIKGLFDFFSIGLDLKMVFAALCWVSYCAPPVLALLISYRVFSHDTDSADVQSSTTCVESGLHKGQKAFNNMAKELLFLCQ